MPKDTVAPVRDAKPEGLALTTPRGSSAPPTHVPSSAQSTPVKSPDQKKLRKNPAEEEHGTGQQAPVPPAKQLPSPSAHGQSTPVKSPDQKKPRKNPDQEMVEDSKDLLLTKPTLKLGEGSHEDLNMEDPKVSTMSLDGTQVAWHIQRCWGVTIDRIILKFSPWPARCRLTTHPAQAVLQLRLPVICSQFWLPATGLHGWFWWQGVWGSHAGFLMKTNFLRRPQVIRKLFSLHWAIRFQGMCSGTLNSPAA